MPTGNSGPDRDQSAEPLITPQSEEAQGLELVGTTPVAAAQGHAGSMIVRARQRARREVPIRERIEVVLGNYASEGCSATNLLAEADATDRVDHSVYRATQPLPPW